MGRKCWLAIAIFAFSFNPINLPAQSNTQAASEPKSTLECTPTGFRNYAIQSANWIESQRIDDGDKTVWPSTPSLNKSVSYSLYNGTSGIVLFYLQLYRATGDKNFLETAKRGANALLDHIETLTIKSDPGYWTGYTGVAATLAEVYQVTKVEKYRDGFQRCMQLLIASAKPVNESKGDGIQFNAVTDIISGSAGIGFFLLYANKSMNEKRALPLAIKLGNGLMDAAERVEISEKTTGLKWMMTLGYSREMPNYSHGTAGICDFLLALDVQIRRTTKAIPKADAANADRNSPTSNYDGRFRKAAIAGALYLESLANDEKSFRIFHHRDRKEIVADPNVETLYYLGWCHGPSGTGRLFMNLASANSQDEHWRHLASRNGTTILTSQIPSKRLPGFWNNVGVCCGSSGVGSFCLDLFQETKDLRFKELAIQLAQDSIDRATTHKSNGKTVGLSWTHAEHRSRPDFVHAQTGIMQGAAGMGIWFLKLDAALNQKDFVLDLPLHPFNN